MSEEKTIFETMGIDYEERNYNSIGVCESFSVIKDL